MTNVKNRAKTFGNLIDNLEVPSDQTFPSRNSSELTDVLGHFPEATAEQVRNACEAAGRAFKTWSKTPACWAKFSGSGCAGCSSSAPTW